jgi:hypothetical protein
MSNNNLVEIKSSNTILQGIVFKYDPEFIKVAFFPKNIFIQMYIEG